MAGLKLETPLESIPGIGPRFLKHLDKLRIKTVRDLVYHFPSRYEDFSEIYKIADLEPGQQATVQGVIREIETHRSWRKRIAVTEAIVEDDSGSIRAIWFNQPFVKNVLRPGRLVNFSGKVSTSEGGVHLSNPIYELIPHLSQKARGEHESARVGYTRHTARLVPIYPETKGLTSKGLRYLLQPILKNLERLPEWIPPEILARYSLPEINLSLRKIHFPGKIPEAEAAKKRFAFEELFLLQLFNFSQKLKLRQEKAPAVKTDLPHLKEIISGLPFTLTISQKKSLWEILKDLEKIHPMNRLLQGDVGSGKTVVAALAAMAAARNGFQAAFMAPTEVLARQHFETLKKLFRPIKTADQPTVALLTASASKIFYLNDLEADVKKPRLIRGLKSGEVSIAIGTHALIQKSVSFDRLGLVIVDEQHRFGVKQRAQLARGQSALTPHFLSMSATPIPRTLMLTVFGDLDISTITETPKDRKKIITKIVSPQNRDKAYQFIRGEVKKGRQAFVICPRIEPQINADYAKISADNISANQYQCPDQRESASPEVKAVKEEYRKLSQKIFPDLKVALLHGQMKSKEKESAMRKFAGGETDILISTSVVEVGVDVPNAAIMMIEGAERFGLAQLYQFRGRVGRGERQSFCLLFTDSDSRAARERLESITKARNGFELAERDLKLRGPGEFIGERQTGLPDVAMKGLRDPELIKASRAAAAEVLTNDQKLNKSSNLKSKLDEFKKKIHLE